MGVVGVEADGGGTGGCRWRGSGVSAVERVVRGGVSGSGEVARVLEKEGGGVYWPELAGDGGRSRGSRGEIVAAWRRARGKRQRGNGEERLAL